VRNGVTLHATSAATPQQVVRRMPVVNRTTRGQVSVAWQGGVWHTRWPHVVVDEMQEKKKKAGVWRMGEWAAWRGEGRW